ncbi:hypothetical protein LB542_13545 [Mesorhizobium sp. BR1-1-9]|uniref:hypothetical protein n=1 Tax=unclassified Mesorhizobium TaxID=325217 RepID=UPI001CD07852|nr:MULTISPECIES: hypothetical protein [unclassified Mesorhizobium]MBZ9871877.1 hypothetical protein [Mesorhizobium sp. BR1-1-9]MBZ9944383.1 hypothetical protein [Mesorhizobium sp. BR1-1-13]
MGLQYENLDQRTRALMVEEIDIDVADGSIYISNYLNEAGGRIWSDLLRAASQSETDDALANALRANRSFKQQVERRKPKGGYTMVAVPVTAAQTLAESQFNMYYMRALARRAREEGKRLTVYRAKAVENPRSESERMIGTDLDPAEVLRVLRETRGVEPSINIPMPNSGLTARLT